MNELCSRLKKEFFNSDKKGKATILASILIIIVLVGASIGMVSNKESEGFTEFYILSSSGHATDIQHDYVAGIGSPIIVGLANHEGKAINYSIEIWQVNYSVTNMAVSVHQMYFIQSLNVTLNSTEVDLNDEYQSQFETEVYLNLTCAGNTSIFFILFEGDSEPLSEYPLNTTKDYSTDPIVTWRIVECVGEKLQYLRLNVEVTEPKTDLEITGESSELPYYFQESIPQNLTVNITNLEYRSIDYSLEIWAVNYTNVNMAIQVKQMYYLGCINVTLNDSAGTHPSYEQTIPLSIPITGNVSVFFILLKGDSEPLSEYPLNTTKDYSTDPIVTWRIVECVNNELFYTEMIIFVYA